MDKGIREQVLVVAFLSGLPSSPSVKRASHINKSKQNNKNILLIINNNNL